MATLSDKKLDEDDFDSHDNTDTWHPVQIGQSVVPKAAARKAKKKCTCHLPIFLPFGRFIFYWETFLCVILIYSIIEIPYTIAFHQFDQPVGTVAIVGFFIDVLLLFDVFINFRTAYIDKYDRLRIIPDPKLIAKKYLKTWFVVDLLSAMPALYLLMYLSTQQNTDYLFGYLRLFRVLKLIRILKLLKTFLSFKEKPFQFGAADKRKTRTFFRLLRVIAAMLLTVHYFACIFYGIGYHAYSHNKASWIDIIVENGDLHAGNFHHYSYAFYWSIVTLFTTGYGDIHAHNIYEQWTCSFAIFVGSCFFAYFIGVLTTALTDDMRHQSKRERLEEAQLFCVHYSLPKELRRAVLTHMRYYNSYNYLFKTSTVMDAMPNHVRKQIQQYLATSALTELDIFESLPLSIVGQIALKLRSKSVGLDQVLYKSGDIGRELYIQRTGKSKLNYAARPNKYRILKRGDVIGENCMLSRTRTDTVICMVWSEFYVLDIVDIVNVLKQNYEPDIALEKWNKIKQTIRDTQLDDNYYKDSDEIIQELGDRSRHHRHVRFKTLELEAEAFDTFVDPRLCEEKSLAASFVDDTHRKKTFSEYEHELEEEDEKESQKERNRKYTQHRHVSFKSIKSLFLERDKSHSRNEAQFQHYTKLKKTSGTLPTFTYAHVATRDAEMDTDGDTLTTDIDFDYDINRKNILQQAKPKKSEKEETWNQQERKNEEGDAENATMQHTGFMFEPMRPMTSAGFFADQPRDLFAAAESRITPQSDGTKSFAFKRRKRELEESQRASIEDGYRTVELTETSVVEEATQTSQKRADIQSRFRTKSAPDEYMENEEQVHSSDGYAHLPKLIDSRKTMIHLHDSSEATQKENKAEESPTTIGDTPVSHE